MRKRTGGRNCGRVKFEVSGTPVRVGLCHCLVCRKETGSLGNFFAAGTQFRTRSRVPARREAGGSRETIATSALYAGRQCLELWMAPMKLRSASEPSMMRQLTSLPFMSCGFRAGSIGSFQLQTLNSIAATERSFRDLEWAACQLVMFLGSVHTVQVFGPTLFGAFPFLI